MKLVFIGPPGVGKGSIAKRVAPIIKAEYIGTGDLLRNEIKKGTGLGLEIEKELKEGHFVPDDIIYELIKRIIKEHDSFILDGFPRTVEQAKKLEIFTQVDKVVEFIAPEDLIIDRLSGRRVCPICGSTYHVKTNLPRTEGICDKEGAKLMHREDDRPNIIKERLRVYHERTEPLMAFYREKGLLERIDAIPPVDAVVERTLELLQ